MVSNSGIGATLVAVRMGTRYLQVDSIVPIISPDTPHGALVELLKFFLEKMNVEHIHVASV